MRIHFTQAPAGGPLGLLERLISGRAEITFGSQTPLDVQILVDDRPKQKTLASLKELQAVVVPYAGVPQSMRELMKGFPLIPLYNLHHNASSTAEKSIELMMAAAKRTVSHDAQLRKSDWSARSAASESMLLEGKKCVVVGYGEIGRRVAAVCVALGMKVSAVRRTVRQGFDGEVSLFGPTGLEQAITGAKVVHLCCPLTSETEGMMTAQRLKLIADGGIIVNVSRGQLIEEEALYKELQSGRLRAGLDVWWSYPKTGNTESPSQFDYASLQNLVLSPHLGGAAPESEELRMKKLAELFLVLIEGRTHRNRVNLDLGY